MKPGQKLWTREELLLAITLYTELTFGQLHQRNPKIIALAQLLGRTPDAVSYKLNNFASIDPDLPRKGMSNVSNLDRQVWAEFFADWNQASYESAQVLAQKQHVELADTLTEADDALPALPPGTVKNQLVKVRVNQRFFRKAVLAAYNNTCCVTGLQQPGLLIAGHIRPWSEDEANRTNPRNGLALNGLHDKAFATGLFTIRPADYVIEVAPALQKPRPDAQPVADLLLRYHGQPLRLPAKPRFLPDPAFLAWHRAKWLTA